jgi:hypothetical protein
MKKIDDLSIGVAGEHLVCADLITQGYTAFLSDQGLPYDVVADIDGKLTKIQVKTTRQCKEVPQRKEHTPAYLFHIKRCGKGGRKTRTASDVDMFALVALDTKQVGYVRSSLIVSTLIVRSDIHRGKYRNEVEKARKDGVIDLSNAGISNIEISKIVGMDLSTVGKILTSKTTDRAAGVYFNDMTLEVCLEST